MQVLPDTIKADKIYELSLDELLRIPVISASKVEQGQADAPNIISAISKDLIGSFGWQSINDILLYQPGFFQSQDYERSTLGFRGMFEGWNNNHLLMLIDGIPFNDNLYGTAYTWDITPMNFLNSLEVIYGPGGSLYGSNAMNGVVTLNTVKVNELNKIGNARMRFGSNNYHYYDIITGTENDDFGVIASFSHLNTSGNDYWSYDASGRVNGTGNPLQFKTNDNRENSYFFTKFYGKNKYDGLMFQYHEQHWSFSTGHGWLFEIPDRPENMREYRRIFALQFAPQRVGKVFQYEFTTRFQIHAIDWNMRFYNDNALNGYYPNGVSEYLNTNANDLFVRAQAKYNIIDHNLILGLESSTFFYNGDKAHNANIDMNTWSDPSAQTYFDLNPWLEYIDKKPVKNIALYFQYLSPKFFEKLQITASGRFDRIFFDYINLAETGTPLEFKSFQMFTPRVALVYSFTGKFILKAIYGKAFRTPSPTEMFGYNTFTLASNISELKPEVITNVDLGLIWEPIPHFDIRVNGFIVNFENQIAYSVANENLSTNIYSLKTGGMELSAHYANHKFSGFTNMSYVFRLNEKILDNTIAESDSKITWAPTFLYKLGALYKYKKFSFTATGFFQSKTYRRNSDKFNGMDSFRPYNYTNAWVNIDVKGSFKLTKKSELGLSVKNLLNTERYLIKNNAYLFDYRMEGRIITGEYVIRF